MSNSTLLTSPAARQAPVPPPRRCWLRRRAVPLVGATALQGACSLLIEIDQGAESEPDAAVDTRTVQPGGPDPDGGAALPEAGPDGDAAIDAPIEPPAPPAAPGLELAFIEDPEEGEAALRLVDARAALSLGGAAEGASWRRTLRPSTQAGDVLDFAWAPDGRRLAVRHQTLDGAQVTLFAAPDWRELPIVAAPSPASRPRTSAAPLYRWSPDGGALALELESAAGPLIGGYVLDAEGARELPALAFSGPVESIGWLSPSALFVIQPDSGAPELLELTLRDAALSSPAPRPLLAAFFPIELRRAAAGLIGASADPANFVFFWPESAEAGLETAFTPFAFLSSRDGFAAEPDEPANVSYVLPIGDSSVVLDVLPECPVVLSWAEGPSQRALAGSRVACLSAGEAAATLTVYSYDAEGARQAQPLDDEALRSAFADAANWEAQARVFSSDGDWLALSTVQHDVLVDLRGPVARYHVRPAASPGATARGFSASGRYMLEQRGARVELAVLAPAGDVPPLRVPLPDAAVELAPCDTARHLSSFCGGPRAARRAAARWAAGHDVASLLAAGQGLSVLEPTEDTVGVRQVPVSTCGSGCVTQYEFAE